jgi:hypothetical protein
MAVIVAEMTGKWDEPAIRAAVGALGTGACAGLTLYLRRSKPPAAVPESEEQDHGGRP